MISDTVNSCARAPQGILHNATNENQEAVLSLIRFMRYDNENDGDSSQNFIHTIRDDRICEGQIPSSYLCVYALNASYLLFRKNDWNASLCRCLRHLLVLERF